jgi:hypothetical protein
MSQICCLPYALTPYEIQIPLRSELFSDDIYLIILIIVSGSLSAQAIPFAETAAARPMKLPKSFAVGVVEFANQRIVFGQRRLFVIPVE